MSLLADFLANRVSASGFSHVVKSRSPFRRTLWAIILVILAILMIVNSYRTLQEYLEYPSMITSKQKVFPVLEFPAVTICSMSPVGRLFAEKDIDVLKELTSILNTLPKYKILKKDRTRCLKDPFCHWNWYIDACKCFSNPCDTLYCYKNVSSDKCECSRDMCMWKDSKDACYENIGRNGMKSCICSSNFTYPLANMNKALVAENTSYNQSYKGCTSEFENIPQHFWEGLEKVNASDRTKKIWCILGLPTDHEVSNSLLGLTEKYGEFPMDSIIVSCDFAGNSCSNFKTLYTGSHGKCYVFNYVGIEATNKSAETVMIPDKKHGITLFMRSSSEDFLPHITKTIGVRIIIHDPRTLPQMWNDGFDLRVDDMTEIGMEYREMNRLDKPWGECGEHGRKVGPHRLDPYKQVECMRECVSQEIVKRCGCYSRKFLRATIIPGWRNLCGFDNNNENKCIENVTAPKNIGQIGCDCPPACNEKLYELSLSSSKLNKDYFKFVREARSLRLVNGTPAVVETDFTSSLMGVQIYYNTIITTHLKQTPLYSWESLIANVGGNMGLFLGISLVTFFEIFEFLLDTVRNAFVKKSNRRKTFVKRKRWGYQVNPY